MSGNIVNLRTWRKRKERADREAEAAENRTRHGRSKVERRFEDARREVADRQHDGRLIETEDDGPTPA
ncbi:MAG: DUF4169 family protein [Thalassobaculum sp.]|uniref:DUF4169 family protein n=1 Tax=Thalassobaculum sp. TaxID=2022740 RepID=UPI0032ECE717